MKKIVLLDKRFFSEGDLRRIEGFLKVRNPEDFLITLVSFAPEDYDLIKIRKINS